jgi:nicotinamide mononucleotide transporter
MIEFIRDTLSGFTAMSYWEYIAVLLSLAYLILAIKESRWCWPAAFISTFIYTVMYWNGALVMESVLNLYYMVMAVVGWKMWQKAQGGSVVPIVSWSFGRHVIIIIVTSIVAIILGYLTGQYMNADLAYLDSFTTCFAIVTTYLVAKKVLENFLYWVVIDSASIYLYFAKGYYPTLVLFIFYTILVCWGYKRWRDEYEQRQAPSLAKLSYE